MQPPSDALAPGRTAFVTGATGFLGAEIAAQLLDAGLRVRALTRTGALVGDLAARGAEVVRGGLGDPGALAVGMRGADLVFHAAADVQMWRGQWAESVRTNVLGTRNVALAALDAGVRRLIFTSSASTIGKPLGQTGDDVVDVDETCAYNLEPLQMVYPHSKWLAEEEVRAAADRGLDAVITHPCAILGPGDWKHNMLRLFLAPRSLAALAVPRGTRTTCDVRDVARAHLAAAERGRSGERYILGGECVAIRSLFDRIAASVGGRRPVATLPDGVMRGLGRALDAMADLTGRPPFLSGEMAFQSTLRVRLSSAKAERELGYRSRPLGGSIDDAAAWYRAQGLL